MTQTSVSIVHLILSKPNEKYKITKAVVLMLLLPHANYLTHISKCGIARKWDILAVQISMGG